MAAFSQVLSARSFAPGIKFCMHIIQTPAVTQLSFNKCYKKA